MLLAIKETQTINRVLATLKNADAKYCKEKLASNNKLNLIYNEDEHVKFNRAKFKINAIRRAKLSLELILNF